MGMVADFFVANEKDALEYGASHLAMSRSARLKRYAPAEWKGIHELQLSNLWALISGEPSDPDRFEIPLVRMENDDEAWLYRLPDSLISALSRLTNERSDSVAAAWVRTEEMRLDGWEVADARRLISDLTKLARRAEEGRLGMYLWGSV